MTLHLPLTRQLVDDKSVALVGNSQAILTSKHGEAIDSHDVVIRINLGVPGRIRQQTAIGSRTDIWAAARYWPEAVPADAKVIVWMKLTKLGQSELSVLRFSGPHCPIEEWPQEYEDACRKFVGAQPSTGIRLAWWMRTSGLNLASLDIYGFDFWEHPTHWSGRRQTPNHIPDRERAAFAALGIKPCPNGLN